MIAYQSEYGGFYLQDERGPLSTSPWIRVSDLGQYIGSIERTLTLPTPLPRNWLIKGHFPCTAR